jgi:HSP20 family protein
MANPIAQKPKQAEEPVARGGPLATFREFPFFLGRMRDEFDRLFDRMSRGSMSVPTGNGWHWGVDIRDEDEAVIVKAEAPGFEAGDFDIQVGDGRLVLKAARKVETKGKDGKVTEYREQECYEAVDLPPGVDRDKVEAKYHNGVLTVTLPKTAQGKAKRVAVKVS